MSSYYGLNIFGLLSLWEYFWTTNHIHVGERKIIKETTDFSTVINFSCGQRLFKFHF